MKYALFSLAIMMAAPAASGSTHDSYDGTFQCHYIDIQPANKWDGYFGCYYGYSVSFPDISVCAANKSGLKAGQFYACTHMVAHHMIYVDCLGERQCQTKYRNLVIEPIAE